MMMSLSLQNVIRREIIKSHNNNISLMNFKYMQKQPLEKFVKKFFYKSFATFSGNTYVGVCFLIQNIAKFFRALILKNICERLLLKIFMKLRKLKIVNKRF